MWPILVTAAMAQSNPVFDVNCDPVGPYADVGPIDVSCDVTLSPFIDEDDVEWGDTQWRMGDGTVLLGDSIAYTYVETGAYDLTVTLRDFAVRGEEGFELVAEEPTRRLGDYFVVCRPPEPEFELVDKGGLTYDAVNTTPVDQPRCLRELTWTVRRAGEQEVLLTETTWEPRFELPEAGPYVVTLTMVGKAGTASSEFNLDAAFNLTSDYYRVFASSCSTVPAPASLGVFGLLALLGWRRARRR